MTPSPTIVKVGGSLFDLPDLVLRLHAVLATIEGPTVLVAGGGACADAVRTFQQHQPTLSDTDAHDAAMRSLSTTAVLLSRLLDWPLLASLQAFPGRVVIDPEPVLRAAGLLDTLPSSWDVTSDSITLTIAAAVGADRVVFLKSCPKPSSWERALLDGIVDPHADAVARPTIDWCDLRAENPTIVPAWPPTASFAKSQPPTDWIDRALRLAASAHAGQTRKGEPTPYITHPVDVSRVLREHGFDESYTLLHAAAILHDTVEDTAVTAADLERDFPPEVSEYVAWTSEMKLDAEGNQRPWKDRKVEHITRLQHAPWPAAAITLADKIHNLRDIVREPRAADYWAIFSAPPSELAWYYQTIVEACRRPGRLDALSVTADELVRRVVQMLGQ